MADAPASEDVAEPVCEDCGDDISPRRAAECGGLCARCEWLVQL